MTLANRGRDVLLTLLMLHFSPVFNAAFEQTLPMQYRIHVKNFQCYPKAANAIVSCNVENGTLINLHAKLQYYQSVDPLFIRVAVYYVKSTADGQQEPNLMFVTAESDLCQYLSEPLHQTNKGFLGQLVRQWSMTGNLRHPCPYQEIIINRWTITDGLSTSLPFGNWLLIITLSTRHEDYDLELVEFLLSATVKSNDLFEPNEV